MTSIRSKPQTAVGSGSWVLAEHEQAERLIEQEVEEFGFAARNELEWLNEHMAEVLNSNQKALTDVFKTPGKLRGKTPRTARKKDPQRAPLTDLFAPNPQAFTSPAKSTPFYQKVSKIQVASHEDAKPLQGKLKSPTRTGKENTDSGYHGMTEDEMDVEFGRVESEPQSQAAQSSVPGSTSHADNHISEDMEKATEEVEEPNSPEAADTDGEVATIPDEDMHLARLAMNSHIDGPRFDENEISIHEDVQEPQTDHVREQDGSDVSSPEKTLVRKSSLNFASLPPRETLTGKRSMTAQHGYTSMDTAQDEEDVGPQETMSDDLAAHNKNSTQRLHDRINMLGQTRASRTSKSIPAIYPALHSGRPEDRSNPENHEDDDEWIAPISNRSSGEAIDTEVPNAAAKEPSSSMYGHQKSISTATLASPNKQDMAPEVARQKSKSVSVPNEQQQQMSTTTPNSSPRKGNEGPLSASKARLYSMLKSAKSVFASSAGASAQGKLETSTLQTAPSKDSLLENGPDLSKMPGSFADDAASTKTSNTASSRPFSAYFSPSKEGKKTRSSTESERKKQQAKEELRSANNLDKLREKERKKAAQQKEERQLAERERQKELEIEQEEMAARQAAEKEDAERRVQEQTQELKKEPSESKLRAPGRLIKPNRHAPAPPARPVPVNIRVPSQSQRLGSTQPASSTTSMADTAPPSSSRPASAASRPGVTRAGSAAPAPNARLKALEAAARKKEKEDQAAAKKADQKKEFERKRAAKLEEDRKAEQERKAEEQRKAQEAKIAAQKQADQKRVEQQRREAAAAAAKAKAEAEMAEALVQERLKAQSAAAARLDATGTIRQLSKSTMPELPNKAANVKRPLQPEAEQGSRTSAMNRGMPSYQQHEAKRRRTNDEEDMEHDERHSVMAPPKRPSGIRKDTISKFTHGYAHAPPPAAHHAQNIYKASIATQPIQAMKPGSMQPHETIKLSNARIPFAENANPPASHPEPSTSKTPTAPVFKTPARPLQNGFNHSTKTKSSPAYPNGDNIALPEIQTDSEDDSDSDTSPATKNATQAFRAPSWVASPALRDLLTQQQLVDPESVFGPIGSLNMDEVFRAGNNKEKERLRRFRERGESAMWVESGDAVTSAEKRRDREAREKVVRDGGWSFMRD